jgi:general secretion pathway protein G
MARKWTARSGMTILEVLVVLTIIALIAAVIGPRLIGYLGRAKSETASLQLSQLRNSVQLFYIDLGRYPTKSEGLTALVQAPADGAAWKGPYLENAAALKDPWGRDYIYTEATGDTVPVIASLGRDGAKGGTGEDADLTQ